MYFFHNEMSLSLIMVLRNYYVPSKYMVPFTVPIRVDWKPFWNPRFLAGIQIMLEGLYKIKKYTFCINVSPLL